MAHTVIPPPRCTAATLEPTHKGNINDKTISERDREVRDFNFTLLASAITRRRHLVIDTHRTDVGVTRQGCHYIHEMIVTANRTCMLLASEDMITQRIDTHLAGAKRATVSVGTVSRLRHAGCTNVHVDSGGEGYIHTQLHKQIMHP